MCGILGYISTTGQGPDLDRLERLALVTETRGRHAWGMAWLDSDGLQVFKTAKPAHAALWSLECVSQAQIMIGHCRWATHGDPSDNRNNHPHPCGTGWMIHNGVVTNYRDLLHAEHLTPSSQCDSEVLGILMARGGGSLGQRLTRTLALAEGGHAILALWDKPARLLIARRGRPLHFGAAPEGLYFASLPEGLPEPRSLPDGYAAILQREAGGKAKRIWEEQFIPF